MAMTIDGSNGVTFPNSSVQIGAASPNQAVVVTDSTNIAMTALLNSGSQQNVGSSFSINIPTSGIIKLSSIVGRFLNSATATQHNYTFGIRINTTNYWFGQQNVNGTLSTILANCIIQGTAVANQYNEIYGFGNSSVVSSSLVSANPASLDIVGLSIPTGTQTVQVVTAYVTTAGTIQGAVKQTRITLEFLAT